MAELPSGTVTLVFTDIEGSTRLLSELGQDRCRDALAVHREAVRDAFARHDGYEVDYECRGVPPGTDAVEALLWKERRRRR